MSERDVERGPEVHRSESTSESTELPVDPLSSPRIDNEPITPTPPCTHRELPSVRSPGRRGLGRHTLAEQLTDADLRELRQFGAGQKEAKAEAGHDRRDRLRRMLRRIG